jgi:hypothetical protein
VDRDTTGNAVGSHGPVGRAIGHQTLDPARRDAALMRDRRQPGLSDLHIVLRRVEARADGANYLAINDDWKATLHLREALRRNSGNATVIDRVLEHDSAS